MTEAEAKEDQDEALECLVASDRKDARLREPEAKWCHDFNGDKDECLTLFVSAAHAGGASISGKAGQISVCAYDDNDGTCNRGKWVNCLSHEIVPAIAKPPVTTPAAANIDAAERLLLEHRAGFASRTPAPAWQGPRLAACDGYNSPPSVDASQLADGWGDQQCEGKLMFPDFKWTDHHGSKLCKDAPAKTFCAATCARLCASTRAQEEATPGPASDSNQDILDDMENAMDQLSTDQDTVADAAAPVEEALGGIVPSPEPQAAPAPADTHAEDLPPMPPMPPTPESSLSGPQDHVQGPLLPPEVDDTPPPPMVH